MAYHCPDCNLRFEKYGPCRRCEKSLVWASGTQPMPEDELVLRIGKLDGDMAWKDMTIPNARTATVVHKFDRDWIAHEDLLAVGYTNLEDFNIVQVKGVYYELQGHVGKLLQNGVKGGAWWAEVVRLDEPFPYPVLSDDDYADLEERRGAEPLGR